MSFFSGDRPAWSAISVLLLWLFGAGSASGETRVAGFSGSVDYAVRGSEAWLPMRTNSVLTAGDRVRTGQDGHVILELSDRSIVRVDRSSLIELKDSSAPGKSGFFLRLGRIFFLNREKPSDIEFETPLVTGAIRGTEFVLSVLPETTRLALLDGAVTLTTALGRVEVASDQQVQVKSDGTAIPSPLVLGNNVVQWALYYPAVLNPQDLSAISDDLKASITAYQEGDFLTAGRTVSAGAPLEYQAAVKLAAGNFEGAETLLSTVQTPLARALRELIDAVSDRRGVATNRCTTSSEWLARSYSLQAELHLVDALKAAEEGIRLGPNFGPAHARVAELLFSLGRRKEAAAALEEALRLSPKLAAAYTVRGFIRLEQHALKDAASSFSTAIRLEERLGDAWLGKALCAEYSGDYEEGRRALQVAAALEPRRSILRSYLGKAWSAAKDPNRAEKEFALAERLDPGDPTPWFYSGLHLDQQNRFNEAIDHLERATELNDNRALFRSRQLLDRDRSVRSADRAAIYDAAGLSEVSERASSRAIEEDYSSFAGHLFRARSLQRLEDENRINLRFESPRQSELLIANLLAPPGAGNLSQTLSQQEHLRLFEQQQFGFSSVTEYRSDGDWLESSSLFGQVGNFGYAVDTQYSARNGEAPNQHSEATWFSAQVQEQITPDDSLYLQLGWMERKAGDLAQYYDPLQSDRDLHVREKQEPTLYAGWHHEWSPGNHTLLLAARLNDELTVQDPNRPLIFVRRDFSGEITEVDYDRARFDLNSRSDFTLYSLEVQQIFERESHALIGGARFQSGSFETEARLDGPIPPPLTDQKVSPTLDRFTAYGYYTWRPLRALSFTAGLSYDRLNFPENGDFAPLLSAERTRDLVSPKFGIVFSPFARTYLRGAYTRSLSGASFDNSIRLEPTEVAGFNQTFRSAAPESVAGIIPGSEFETWSVALDQSFRSHTYMGISAELLRSDGDRTVGAVGNSIPVPIPDTPIQLREELRFEERSLSVYANQLLGREWSIGGRYRVSNAELDSRFPEIPSSAFDASVLSQSPQATLHQAELFLIYNHPCGFFGEWASAWYAQSNRGYAPDEPGADFWQHNLYIGYRMRQRRAELRVGIENLTAHHYHLNPLNYYLQLPRDRTFVARLKLNF